MKRCPCGSLEDYNNCCGPYIDGPSTPVTPEALMRSRYTAYSLGNISYIKKTMQGQAALGFDELEAAKWARSVLWLGLQVMGAEFHGVEYGTVEFVARYLDKNVVKSMHETSWFQLIKGAWYYMEGEHVVEPSVKISRNEPCPCGSEKKFKNCHGRGG